MRTALIRSACACALLLAAVTPLVAAADSPSDRDAARALADAGFDLFSAGKYPEAIAKLEAAEAKFHAPTNLLFLARAEEKLGKLVAARRHYERAAEPLPPTAPKAFRKAAADAEAGLAALDLRLPRVRIALRAPSGKVASVQIDGAPVEAVQLAAPIPLDPGEHTVVALVDGAPVANARVELAEGAPVREVVLDIAVAPAPAPVAAPSAPTAPSVPATPSAPSGSRPGSIGPAVAMFAIGGAALVAGGVTGGLSLAKVHDLKAACPTNPCSDSHRDLADSARMLGNISTAGFVVGGVGAAAGVVLVLVRRSAAATPDRVSVHMGPEALSVEGSF